MLYNNFEFFDDTDSLTSYEDSLRSMLKHLGNPVATSDDATSWLNIAVSYGGEDLCQFLKHEATNRWMSRYYSARKTSKNIDDDKQLIESFRTLKAQLELRDMNQEVEELNKLLYTKLDVIKLPPVIAINTEKKNYKNYISHHLMVHFDIPEVHAKEIARNIEILKQAPTDTTS